MALYRGMFNRMRKEGRAEARFVFFVFFGFRDLNDCVSRIVEHVATG